MSVVLQSGRQLNGNYPAVKSRATGRGDEAHIRAVEDQIRRFSSQQASAPLRSLTGLETSKQRKQPSACWSISLRCCYIPPPHPPPLVFSYSSPFVSSSSSLSSPHVLFLHLLLSCLFLLFLPPPSIPLLLSSLFFPSLPRLFFLFTLPPLVSFPFILFLSSCLISSLLLLPLL